MGSVAGTGMPDPPHEGGCLCGKIRYRITDDPLTLYACHCTDCQRQTGSSFGLSMIVARPALELLRGEPRQFRVVLPDGRQKHGNFCGECATRLWGEPAKAPEVVTARPGTLDDTSWVRPVGHIWTRSARAPFPEGPLSYEGQPESMLDLVRAWRNLVHSNIDQRFPSWAHYFLPTVQLHNLHHAKNRRHQDTNFSGSSAIWDVLFGTFSHPDRCELGPLGIEDSPVPSRFAAQLLFPFRCQGSPPQEPARAGTPRT